MVRRRFTSEELIQVGRELVGEYGPELTQMQFCTEAGCSPGVVVRRFGSWGRFRMQLGLGRRDRRGSRREYSDEELFEALREAATEHGPDLSIAEFTLHTGRSHQLVYTRFGSWDAFRAAAGLPAKVGVRKYTKGELIAQGRAAYQAFGCNLTLGDFVRHTGIPTTTLYRRFRTWEEFRECFAAAARNPGNGRLRKYTREGLIELIRRVAEQAGSGLTKKEFIRRTGIADGTISRHFRTWAEARDCADLPPYVRAAQRYSDEFLLEDFGRVAGLVRGMPTRSDYKQCGTAAVETLIKRFGETWEDVQDRYERYREWKASFPHGPPRLSRDPEERRRQQERVLEELSGG